MAGYIDRDIDVVEKSGSHGEEDLDNDIVVVREVAVEGKKVPFQEEVSILSDRGVRGSETISSKYTLKTLSFGSCSNISTT